MHDPNEIRFLVLGLIKDHNNRVFLSEGYDKIKQEYFYRALGGGVDFGESSLKALKREFQEELNAELVNIQYVTCLESIFSFNGQPGHEVIQVYQCDFANPNFYQLEEITFNEGERKKIARWVDLEKCRSRQVRVVPEPILEYM
ncbi:NUDIX domain-containing protein [Euhalothece natronophila Z-M001]|uniref:NUDIX domain-containing protein n=1 Tax=Euhalothece natronophila Z-M001 TaxID=522448 RepID=A0A5B8NMU3_9CHRO|nr:NUDIX domain-containing protein [Euhalothece natronophila]QDZ39595.1 NUDIX domain-containing protein [Euhalothece natronophila Z-M001]